MHSHLGALLLVLSFVGVSAFRNSTQPNVVFLIVESTDGRQWRDESPAPLPNLRKLMSQGVRFDSHYSNAPVCCPSRASLWSGRAPHKIKHEHLGLEVGGVWNNFEGLPQGYDALISNYVEKAGYQVKISGKTDWTVGGHSENVRLNSWTMYTPFPYDIPNHGGWDDETGDCASNGTVVPGNVSAHQGDWKSLNETVAWIGEVADKGPFFAYQGMSIVHPPYVTNEYWYDQIDPSKVDVPAWAPLDSLHPCDLQSSMLKGCTPSNATAAAFYSTERRRRIRRINYAEVAEFDSMVGAYMEAVQRAGVADNTVFIVTSDHGDMRMEHQQHYKMVPYEASSHVPLVIGGAVSASSYGTVVTHPTSHLDLFPTISDITAADKPTYLDGYSLLPWVAPVPNVSRPSYVVSQFHGCNIAMSWFMIRQGDFKLVVYGTGGDVPHQLFHLPTDPNEMHNLWLNKAYSEVSKVLEGELRRWVDYPTVAMDVATYNHAMLKQWTQTTKDWKDAIKAKDLRWTASWDFNATGSLDAVERFLAEPPTVRACRRTLVYP